MRLPRSITAVASLTDLQTLDTSGMESGDLAFVAASALGPATYYTFDADSVAAVEAGNVYYTANAAATDTPASEPGRWRRVIAQLPVIGVVPNVAALAAYDDAALDDGALMYVQSVRSYWSKLEGANPGVVDNITNVRNPTNTATWLRDEMRSPSWQTVANWRIDAINGDDENLGTPAAPLASWAEFYRRVNTLATTMTVTIASTLNERIAGTFCASPSLTTPVDLNIVGLPTVVVDAGSVTTFTNPNVTLGACAQGTMTSAAVPNFAAHVGRFLLAADDYATPILGVNGAAPILALWGTEFYDCDKPANGTQVDIVDLPGVLTLQLNLTDGVAVNVKYLKFTSTTFGDAVSILQSTIAAGSLGCTFFACDFQGFLINQSDIWYLACQVSGADPVLDYVRDYNISFWLAGGSRGRTWRMIYGGHTQFQGFIIQGGGGLEVGWDDHQSPPSSIGLWGEDAGLGVFGSSSNGAAFSAGADVTGKVLYGANNAGYGLRAQHGARVNVMFPPTITGTLGDLLFDESATAIPPLVAGAAVPAAQPLTTWNQYNVNFARRVMSYRNGTVLSVETPIP